MKQRDEYIVEYKVHKPWIIKQAKSFIVGTGIIQSLLKIFFVQYTYLLAGVIFGIQFKRYREKVAGLLE